MKARTALFALSALLVPPGLAAAETSSEAFRLIDARLELMQPVAAWKDARGVAVEDREREAVVLEKAVAAAEESGIAPDTAAAFFRAQIEAAKEIQVCWIERWTSGEAVRPGEVPDLKEEIRPQLIQIGAELLAAVRERLGSGAPFLAEELPAFRAAVEVDCLTEETRDGLFEALTRMTLAGNGG